MIRKYVYVTKAEIKFSLGILICSFLGGQLIAALMRMFGDGDEKIVTMSTLFMISAIAFIALIQGMMGIVGEFNLIVGMGVTRKQFFTSFSLYTIIEYLIFTGFVYVGYFLEQGILKMVYDEREKLVPMNGFLLTPYVIPALFLLLGFSFCCGALVLKFGKKIFWGLWAIWMFCCFFLSRIVHGLEKNMSGEVTEELINFGKRIVQWGEGVHCIIMFVGAAILFYTAYLMIRKQRVTENIFL